MGKQRLAFIDICKFIGIFLMVLGHSGLKSNLIQFVYSFHMPLFFIVSGFTSPYDNFSLGEFINKRIKSILIPYFLFALILCFGSNIGSWGYILYSSRTSLFLGDSFTPLWFLPCFFLSAVIYKIVLILESKAEVIFSFGIKGAFFWLLIALCALIGFYFPLHNKLLKVGYPFSINVSFIGAVLMGFGRILRNSKFFELKNYQLAAISIILYLIGLYTYKMNLPDSVTPDFGHVEMAIASYGNSTLFLVNAFILTFATICLSVLVDRGKLPFNNLLEYIGKNSLLLLCIHGILLSVARKTVSYAYNSFGLTSDSVSYFLLSTIIVVALAVPIMPIIIKYAPNLVGRKID
jgi:fucose 4-O-acetylase-like acetyltransferase